MQIGMHEMHFFWQMNERRKEMCLIERNERVLDTKCCEDGLQTKRNVSKMRGEALLQYWVMTAKGDRRRKNKRRNYSRKREELIRIADLHKKV